ncbi:MAG: hypothetical protein FWD57_15890 [Polyangiaceae bacterium]|nr:hypothetical protein [Polyangiaceae bacterium]
MVPSLISTVMAMAIALVGAGPASIDTRLGCSSDWNVPWALDGSHQVWGVIVPSTRDWNAYALEDSIADQQRMANVRRARDELCVAQGILARAQEASQPPGIDEYFRAVRDAVEPFCDASSEQLIAGAETLFTKLFVARWQLEQHTLMRPAVDSSIPEISAATRDNHAAPKLSTSVRADAASLGTTNGNDAAKKNAVLVDEADSHMLGLHRALDEMKELPDNWDDEGASRPADASIARAHELLRWIKEAGLHKFDVFVDPDVLEDVAI